MQLKEVPGHIKLKEKLVSSIITGKISHAQIFYGQEGGAQLALAIGYIQYLFCQSPQANDSCGKCPSCIQVSKFSHPDLHFSFPFNKNADSGDKPTSTTFHKKWVEFLEGAPYFTKIGWLKHLGIENKQAIINTLESQEIAKKLSLKSYSGGYKAMIIWLPETLHTTAANKLLKLIEEPEPNTIILLVSNNYESVLGTIRSRCQGINVAPNKPDEVKSYLEIRHGSTALDYIAMASNGSIGKALTLIDNQDLFENYAQIFVDLHRAAFGKKLKDLVHLSENLSREGREQIIDFLKYSLSLYQSAMMQNQNMAVPKMTNLESVGFKFESFSQFISPERAKNLSAIIEEAIKDISRNISAKIALLDTFLKISVTLKN